MGSGAQLHNSNALSTATRVNVHRLTLGRLPRRFIAAERVARTYRRSLEQAVVAQKGEIGLKDAHWLDSAVKHELHALMLRRILREQTETLTAVETVRISESIAKASESRNRCYGMLELDQPPPTQEQMWDAMWSQPLPPLAPPSHMSPATASGQSSPTSQTTEGTDHASQ